MGGGERGSARVVLMCGLAGSGKTTYAQGLEAAGLVRLSIDEEIWSRFGRFGVDYEPVRYAELSAIAEEALCAKLVALVGQGRDVVVDASFWRQTTRDRYKRLIEDAGGRWRLVYLKADAELLRRRLRDRSRRFDANAAFPITEKLLGSYLAAFEEPHDEGQEVLAGSLSRSSWPPERRSAAVHDTAALDGTCVLRDALPGDAPELTSLLLRSRTQAMPWLVSPHGEPSTRWWMQHTLLTECRVRVVVDGSRLLGFAAVTDSWLEQLYVHPHHQNLGVGRTLLDDAKRLRPGGLRLHVFTRNAAARRFYEAQGCRLVEQSNGDGNEEHEPDCTYAWLL